MAKNLYVGNLPYNTTADDLRDAFSQFGTVARAQVVEDRETGRSRGFGFIEMSDGGEAAVEAMNGAPFQGRTLTVNEAPVLVKNGDRAAEEAGNDQGVTVEVAADATKAVLLIYLIIQLNNALIAPTDQGVLL